MVSKLEVARSVDITVCIFKLTKHFLRQAYELYHIFDFLQHGFCFGFVEFEELSSMQSALEVHIVYFEVLVCSPALLFVYLPTEGEDVHKIIHFNIF